MVGRVDEIYTPAEVREALSAYAENQVGAAAVGVAPLVVAQQFVKILAEGQGVFSLQHPRYAAKFTAFVAFFGRPKGLIIARGAQQD